MDVYQILFHTSICKERLLHIIMIHYTFWFMCFKCIRLILKKCRDAYSIQDLKKLDAYNSTFYYDVKNNVWIDIGGCHNCDRYIVSHLKNVYSSLGASESSKRFKAEYIKSCPLAKEYLAKTNFNNRPSFFGVKCEDVKF